MSTYNEYEEVQKRASEILLKFMREECKFPEKKYAREWATLVDSDDFYGRIYHPYGMTDSEQLDWWQENYKGGVYFNCQIRYYQDELDHFKSLIKKKERYFDEKHLSLCRSLAEGRMISGLVLTPEEFFVFEQNFLYHPRVKLFKIHDDHSSDDEIITEYSGYVEYNWILEGILMAE